MRFCFRYFSVALIEYLNESKKGLVQLTVQGIGVHHDSEFMAAGAWSSRPNLFQSQKAQSDESIRASSQLFFSVICLSVYLSTSLYIILFSPRASSQGMIPK